MNNQDATEMLKSMLPEKISYAELVGAVGCYGGGEYVYSDPEPYAIETAISALEKQIPKKPREHYNWCDLSEDEKLETPRWYCESCDGAIKENYSYCHDCGQAIDWSVE